MLLMVLEPASTATLTLLGTGTGLVPIRLIVGSSTFGLLDDGDELSADFLLTADSVRQHTTTGGDDADAQTSQRAWQVRSTAVNAASRTGDAIDTGDDGLATAAVAERDVDQALTAVFDRSAQARASSQARPKHVFTTSALTK